MRILVLGGTGSIGSGVVAALLERGHDVVALARSASSADKLRLAGAGTVEGDIVEPRRWIHVARDVDGVVQAAATWKPDMDAVDRRLVDALLAEMAGFDPPKALLYTGGCWLYGQTGDTVANEASPFRPPEGFAGSIPIIGKVLSDAGVRGMVIHPGMVYEARGGVFDFMYEDAKARRRVRVIGGENVRWPLVHKDDLGVLYALMLERGKPGDTYCAAAADGIAVGEIARAIAKKFDIGTEVDVIPVPEAKRTLGEWYEGYAIDQQMSGDKARAELGWRPVHGNPIVDVLQ